jgi:hypothetical protein
MYNINFLCKILRFKENVLEVVKEHQFYKMEHVNHAQVIVKNAHLQLYVQLVILDMVFMMENA